MSSSEGMKSSLSTYSRVENQSGISDYFFRQIAGVNITMQRVIACFLQKGNEFIASDALDGFPSMHRRTAKLSTPDFVG